MKFYIAFSIHGTNSFTVATNELPWGLGPGEGIHTVMAHVRANFGPDFDVVQSRRPGHKPERDGYKLTWSKLNRKSDGKPHERRDWVTKRFQQLQKMGWTIVKGETLTCH